LVEFEIVKGDYGRGYVGIVEDVDYSDCTVTLNLWDKNGTAKLTNKACAVTHVGDDTHVTFVPAINDFDLTPDIYYGNFKFTKAGVVEHTLPFTWRVYEKES